MERDPRIREAEGLQQAQLARRGIRKWSYAAAAATFLVAIGLYVINGAQPGEVYTTPVGGLSKVPTADGSTITLNTDTQVRVQVSDEERRIDLERGEAFFDVAKDPSRPFAVYANGKRIVAIGTKFSVRLQQQAVHVVVTEGTVRLEEHPGFLTRVTESSPSDSPRVASAGTVVNLRSQQVDVERLPLPQIEQTLSWRSGYVVLDKTPLAEAVAEFNRYNARQFVIQDTALEEIRVGGNFRTNNVDGLVRLLERGFSVEAQEQNGTIFLRKR